MDSGEAPSIEDPSSIYLDEDELVTRWLKRARDSLGILHHLWVGPAVGLLGIVYAIWWKRKQERISHFV